MLRVDPRLTFAGMVKAEWVKLWALRSPKLVAAGMVVLPLVLGALRVLSAPPSIATDSSAAARVILEAVSISALPVAFVGAILGLIAAGAEHPDDARSAILMVAPRPAWLVLAKIPPVAIGGVASAATGVAAAGAFAHAVVVARGGEPLPFAELTEVIACTIAGVFAFGVLAISAAAMSRTTIIAVVGFAIAIGILPSLFGVLGLGVVSDLQPASAVQAAVTRPPAVPFTLASVPVSGLPWGGGLLVLGGWCIGAIAVAVLVSSYGLRTINRPERRRRVRAGSHTGTPRPIFANLLRAELLKASTAPATWWLGGLALVGTFSLSYFVAMRLPLDPDPRSAYAAAAEIESGLVASVPLVQLLIAFLSITIFTSDYSTGVLRATLIAAPRRGALHAAKLTTALLVSCAISIAGVTTTAPFVVHIAAQVGLNAPLSSVLIIMARIVASLAMIAIVGAGIGNLLRAPVPVVAAVLAILVILPSLTSQLSPVSRGTSVIWVLNAFDFLPAPILAAPTLQPDVSMPQWLDGNVLQLTPDQSMLVLLAWTLSIALISHLIFVRRSF